jgi:hypothetical protein
VNRPVNSARVAVSLGEETRKLLFTVAEVSGVWQSFDTNDIKAHRLKGESNVV